MTKYAVTMRDADAWEFDYRHEFEGEKAARTHADKLARENPSKRVYIEFFRQSDGMSGYINRYGVDNVGESWTEAL